MKIAGFKKQSLIDFPGNISSVIFTQGCNFRCPYCHNPNLVLANKFEKLYNKKIIFNYLNNYQNLLDAVCITGGEPSIHNDLPKFIFELKNFNLKIKLDTNGTNPDMLNLLIKDKLIDFVAMDIKHLLEFDLYNKAVGYCLNKNIFEKILTSINIIQKSNINYEFRTTVAKGLHSEKDIKILKKLFPKNYKIQNVKTDIMLNPQAKLESFENIE
jgi:pyruvate formate lyase activating enzyme